MTEIRSSSLPSELFGDFLDDLGERYHNEKKKVVDIVKVNGKVMNNYKFIIRNWDWR